MATSSCGLEAFMRLSVVRALSMLNQNACNFLELQVHARLDREVASVVPAVTNGHLETLQRCFTGIFLPRLGQETRLINSTTDGQFVLSLIALIAAKKECAFRTKTEPQQYPK
jgi:hypothetical protein